RPVGFSGPDHQDPGPWRRAAHRLEQVEGAQHIDGERLDRTFERSRGAALSGQMDDRVRARGVESARQRLPIGEIAAMPALDLRPGRSLLDPETAHRRPVPGEHAHQMESDESGGAGDQHPPSQRGAPARANTIARTSPARMNPVASVTATAVDTATAATTTSAPH